MENSSMKTKYPILLLHGVGFRDLRWPLYWGRIPSALSGAELFYGNQDCWARVEDNARTIKARIRQILDETDTKKVNMQFKLLSFKKHPLFPFALPKKTPRRRTEGNNGPSRDPEYPARLPL